MSKKVLMETQETQGFRRVKELDGVEAVNVARGLEHLGGLVFFDTAGNVPAGWGRALSVVAAAPRGVVKGSVFCKEDVLALRDKLTAGRRDLPDDGLPGAGLFGWVSYEGDFVFGEYDEVLVRDEETGEWWENGGLFARMGVALQSNARPGKFVPSGTREEFVAAVERAREWIAAGDIYQVNLAQEFVAAVEGEGSLFPLYEVLREASPAPMGAWLALDDKEILSTSPELFLKISGRSVETRPIKGTRPRYRDADEDLRAAVELQTSPKEISELVMITDLLRNDLGQVCEFGSVEVSRMLELESLAQVHHLVSTVRGRLREGEDAVSALVACFPGGSITGAPKKRAREIISELEKPGRGVYCGAIGWLGFQGESEFNIAIRTMVREGAKLSYQVGAGIVADSVAEAEYEETMQKGTGIRVGVERFLKIIE